MAAFSGIVMAVCTLKGYDLLGGKMTQRGIVISVMFMLLMTYCANRLDWAIFIAQEFGSGFTGVYRAIPQLIQAEVIDKSSYYVNLVQVYLFTLVGAVPMVRNLLKSQKEEGSVYCMEEARNHGE